jgi:hypothetical protein
MMDVYRGLFLVDITGDAGISANKGVILTSNNTTAVTVTLTFFDIFGLTGATANVSTSGGQPTVVPMMVKGVGAVSGGKVLGIN